ncbi:MAG: MoaD/ThiS family protein [Candidatus Asgardarchaeia archaeon]|nr:MoaD/ThiS family protein [Candidatus Odinarchaeota archaeon]
MKIKLKLLGNLHLEGKKETELELPGNVNTIEQLVRYLSESYALFGFTSIDKIFTNFVFLLNDQDISVLNREKTKLKENSRLVIIPLIHGG